MAEKGNFSLSQCFHTGVGALPVTYSVDTGGSLAGAAVTGHEPDHS